MRHKQQFESRACTCLEQVRHLRGADKYTPCIIKFTQQLTQTDHTKELIDTQVQNKKETSKQSADGVGGRR
jgi:hypothetical protein